MLESGAISEIALIFAADEDFDSQINRTLALVGERLSVSRCELFLDSPDGKTKSNTHEWCAEGVESAMHLVQGQPRPQDSAWDRLLEGKAVLAIEDIRSLPPEIREDFERADVVSTVIAPIRIAGRLKGTVNFHECAGPRVWNMFEMETLKTIAGIITTACSRRVLAERLSVSEENFRNFFDTVDDIIVIADSAGRVIHANKGAVRRLGYAIEESTGRSVLDFLPTDTLEKAEGTLEAIVRKELDHCSIDFQTKDGTRIPVDTRIWFGQWGGRERIFSISKDLSAELAALQKFEVLFRSNPAGMAISDMQTRRFVDVNDSLLETFGCRKEEVIGHTMEELGIVVDEAGWALTREQLLRDGSIHGREFAVRPKGGGLVQGLFSGQLMDICGRKHCLMVMMDVTEQDSLRRELAIEHDRLLNALESTRLGAWEWHVRTGETLYNERWAEMIGYTLAELTPTDFETWTRFVHPDDLPEAQRLIQEHLEGRTEYYESEFRMRHKNGDWIWILDRGKVLERDSVGRPLRMYGTHLDITGRKAMEQEIRELAIRDPLTGVYNRRHFFERIAEMVAEYSRYGRNFCIAVLDIDRFKHVNDEYGHQAGDHVLREFAGEVGSRIRQYDLLGRYGGEEFILVSVGARAAEMMVMMQRFLAVIREKTFLFDGREIRLTFSCGVADSSEFSRGELSVEAIVALADRRLYAAKDRGRDCCVGPENDAGGHAGRSA